MVYNSEYCAVLGELKVLRIRGLKLVHVLAWPSNVVCGLRTELAQYMAYFRNSAVDNELAL